MARPTDFPDHDTGDINSTTTDATVKASGWPELAQVPNASWNWLHRTVGLWVRYLDDVATTQFGVQHDISDGTHTTVTAISVEVAGAGALQQTGSGHIQATGTGDIRQTGTGNIEVSGAGHIQATGTGDIKQAGTGNIISDNAARTEDSVWSGDLVLGGYVHVSGTQDDVNNTVAETTFPTGTVTIPAGYTTDGRSVIRTRGCVKVTSTTGSPTVYVTVYVGGTTITQVSLSSAQVGDHVTFDVEAAVLSSGDLAYTFLWEEEDGGVSTVRFFNGTSAGFNSAASQDVKVTAQWGTASASNNARLVSYTVEVHKR